MMNELLPCPFCGGEAQVRGSFMDGFRVECCGLCFASTQRYRTEAEAIAAWNTRCAGTCRKANINEPDWLVCSECGCQTKGDQYGELPKFCSNCGREVSV